METSLKKLKVFSAEEMAQDIKKVNENLTNLIIKYRNALAIRGLNQDKDKVRLEITVDRGLIDSPVPLEDL